ncbi:MAG: type II toxin-antitoxin system VapC family toxin [Gammaproteobacteria bacterium]
MLLDTHVWIWWLTGQPELPPGQREALDRLAERELPFLSAISLWEAQMLHAKGRLTLDRPFDRWLRAAACPEMVRILPLDVDVVLSLSTLPARFHGDPADRIIVATARVFDLPLLSFDSAIRKGQVVRLWKAP